MIRHILLLTTCLLFGATLTAQTNYDLMLKKASSVKGLCGNYDRLILPKEDGQPLVEVAKLSDDIYREAQVLQVLAEKSQNEPLIRLSMELMWAVRYQLLPQTKMLANGEISGGVGAGQVTEILERLSGNIRREIQQRSSNPKRTN